MLIRDGGKAREAWAWASEERQNVTDGVFVAGCGDRLLACTMPTK